MRRRNWSWVSAAARRARPRRAGGRKPQHSPRRQAAQARRRVGLRIEGDEKGGRLGRRERRGEIYRGSRLADATLLVRHNDDPSHSSPRGHARGRILSQSSTCMERNPSDFSSFHGKSPPHERAGCSLPTRGEAAERLADWLRVRPRSKHRPKASPNGRRSRGSVLAGPPRARARNRRALRAGSRSTPRAPRPRAGARERRGEGRRAAFRGLRPSSDGDRGALRRSESPESRRRSRDRRLAPRRAGRPQRPANPRVASSAPARSSRPGSAHPAGELGREGGETCLELQRAAHR